MVSYSKATEYLMVGFLSTILRYVALASDPSPLQDFCVADNKSKVLVNGVVCKDPKMVTENDFFFSGLNKPGNTNNAVGSFGLAAQIPGLNTLGIVIARVDYAPGGIFVPHIHHRATEILTVLVGTLRVGFVTSAPDFRHITKVLKEGDVFVFPQGLVHYQQNIGHGNAVVIAALNSQNPGLVPIPLNLFGATPDIPADILAKAFQLDQKIIYQLQSIF